MVIGLNDVMLIWRIKYLVGAAMQLKAPLYLTQPTRYQLETRLLSREGDLFEFEETIFHLQGGGQPDDKGCILFQENKLDILGGVVDKETGTVRVPLRSCATNCRLARSCPWGLTSRCSSTLQCERLMPNCTQQATFSIWQCSVLVNPL